MLSADRVVAPLAEDVSQAKPRKPRQRQLESRDIEAIIIDNMRLEEGVNFQASFSNTE